jgi:hypothetical protein
MMILQYPSNKPKCHEDEHHGYLIPASTHTVRDRFVEMQADQIPDTTLTVWSRKDCCSEGVNIDPDGKDAFKYPLERHSKA